MTQKFTLIATGRFEKQARNLPDDVFSQLAKCLRYLETDPRRHSLQTHEVKGAIGYYGGKVFEAYINEKYRFTREYGESRGEIVLRNADNHDECLHRP